LVVAVAAEGVEDVSGEALRVDTDDWGICVDVPHDEGDGAFDGFARGVAGDWDAFEAEDAEVSPAGGEVGFGNFGDAGYRHGYLSKNAASVGVGTGDP
jgi:hypothetical protein